MTGCQVPLAGFEPASQDPESWGLSISLQGLEAEGAGVEPARAFTRWFSKPLPYRPAHPPTGLKFTIKINKIILIKLKRGLNTTSFNRS